MLAAGLGFTHGEVSAFQHREHEFHTAGKLHAAVIHQPIHGFVGVFGEVARQLFVAVLLTHGHHVFVEFVHGVRSVGALGLLSLRVYAQHKARGIDGVAGGAAHLIDEERFQTVLCGTDGTDQTAAAGTHDNAVVLCGLSGRGNGFRYRGTRGQNAGGAESGTL